MIGHVLKNEYKILELLGSDSLSSTYLVEKVSSGKKFKLRQFNKSFSSKPAIEKHFYQEAELLPKLAHDNVLIYHDFFTEHKCLNMVMEDITGTSLGSHAESQRLPVLESVRMIKQVLNGMSYVHKMNVIHGCLRPDNVFIRRDGKVKIIDFGLAGMAQVARSEGDDFGLSPAYLAPEQLDGSGRFGATADVYAIGLILYELLAGEPAFQGADDSEIVRKQQSIDPQLLQDRLNESYKPFDELLARALAKKPEERLASCSEFSTQLRQLERDWVNMSRPKASDNAKPSSTMLYPMDMVNKAINPDQKPADEDDYTDLTVKDEVAFPPPAPTPTFPPPAPAPAAAPPPPPPAPEPEYDPDTGNVLNIEEEMKDVTAEFDMGDDILDVGDDDPIVDGAAETVRLPTGPPEPPPIPSDPTETARMPTMSEPETVQETARMPVIAGPEEPDETAQMPTMSPEAVAAGAETVKRVQFEPRQEDTVAEQKSGGGGRKVLIALIAILSLAVLATLGFIIVSSLGDDDPVDPGTELAVNDDNRQTGPSDPGNTEEPNRTPDPTTPPTVNPDETDTGAEDAARLQREREEQERERRKEEAAMRAILLEREKEKEKEQRELANKTPEPETQAIDRQQALKDAEDRRAREKARLEEERRERERQAEQAAEAARKEARDKQLREERARIAAEEADRKAKEEREAEAARVAEAARKEKERQDRLASERAAAEKTRREQEARELERRRKEKLEQDRIAAELERKRQQKADAERLAEQKRQEEQARLERERKEREEQERIARQRKAEEEKRLAAEREKRRQEALIAEKKRKEEQDRLAREKEERLAAARRAEEARKAREAAAAREAQLEAERKRQAEAEAKRVAEAKRNAEANAAIPEVPEDEGLEGENWYEVVIRDEDGNFIPNKEVIFYYAGKKKTVRSDYEGTATLQLETPKAVEFEIQGNRKPFGDQDRVNYTLRKKEHPISFKVYINGAETTDGTILISKEGSPFKKVSRPGGTEKLLAGTYYFTYQHKATNYSETFTVRRRARFVFEINSDPNAHYRDLYFKKNIAGLEAAVKSKTDPKGGYEFFMPRYWLARCYLEPNGNKKKARELLEELYKSNLEWERMAIKPNYILDYLSCLENPNMAARVCRDDSVLRQFQTLSLNARESNWKFEFYYYRIVALDQLASKRTGSAKARIEKQISKTFDWLDEIPLDTINRNPEKYGRLTEINDKITAK